MTGTPGRRSLHIRSASEKVEDERGRAPANGGSSPNSDKLDTINPLETRVTQIEGNLESLRTGMNQILDALKQPQNGAPVQNGAPAQVPQAAPQWSTPSQPQQQNGQAGGLGQALEAIKTLNSLDGGSSQQSPLAERLLDYIMKDNMETNSLLKRVAIEKLTSPRVA